MNLSIITSVLLIIFSFYFTSHAWKITRHFPKNGDWRLNIIHTNDMHSRFEEISASATPCSDKQKQKNECYGGFARISTLVKQARKSSTPTLFLNAGDTYFGSTWFIHYGWEIVAKFLNILKPDAINTGEYGGSNGWTDAAVAIYNSGAIKTSIDKSHQITSNDIYTVLAHYNVIGTINITGKKLLEVLEFSVESLKPDPGPDPSGRFLQVSGLKIVYNLLQPDGLKVVRDSTLIRCADCDVPKYEKIIEDKIYKILTVDYLHIGGDGFTMLKNLPWQPNVSGITTRDALVRYIKKNLILYPSIEDRIKFINEQKTDVYTNDGNTYSIDIDLDILND